MGDEDIGSPQESPPAATGTPDAAAGPVHPWLVPSFLTAYLETHEKLLQASMTQAVVAARQAEEQVKLSFSLAEDIAHETVAFGRAQAALEQSEAILNVVGGALQIGMAASNFSAGIASAHDPRLVAPKAEAHDTPSDRAPAMVWRTYASQSFFSLATRAERFSASIPAVRPIAKSLSSAAPAYQKTVTPSAAPHAQAAMPPVQTMRSLAQAARSAASPLLAEGFGSQLSAAFASAANLFDRASHPAPAPGSTNFEKEIESELHALQALLAELAKGRYGVSKGRPAKQGAMDAFRGHPAENVANAPNQDLSGSLRAVRSLSSQLLEFSNAPTPVRAAQKTAGALSEVVSVLENSGALAPAQPESEATPAAKPRKTPEPTLRQAITIGATNALAKTAAFGNSVAATVVRARDGVGAGIQRIGGALTPPPAMPGLALAGGGMIGMPAPPSRTPRATSDSGDAMSFRGGPVNIGSSLPRSVGGSYSQSGIALPERGSAPQSVASPSSAPAAPPLASVEDEGRHELRPIVPFTPSVGVPRTDGFGGSPTITPTAGQVPGIGGSPTIGPRRDDAPGIGGNPSLTPEAERIPGIGGSPMPTPAGIGIPDVGGSPSFGHIGLPDIGPPPTPGIRHDWPGAGRLPDVGGSPTPTVAGDRLPDVGSSPMRTVSGDRLPDVGGSPTPKVAGERLPEVGGSPMPTVGGDRLPDVGASPTPAAGEDSFPDAAGGPGWRDPEDNPSAFRDTLIQSGGPGTVPDTLMRQQLQPHLGFDPALARFHTGPEAAEAAQQVQAQAFTIGRDVFFGQGRFAPETREGLSLIGHEVTHVGQQTGALGDRVQRFSERGGDEMERQAREVATGIFAARPGAFQVDEYVCEFTSQAGRFGSDEDRRLERFSIEAFEAAEKVLVNWNGDLGTVVVDLAIAPGEMSDSLIVQRWRDAIVNAVRSASPSEVSASSPNVGIQKFDSFEHVQLGDDGAGKSRKFKLKQQRDREGMDPSRRDALDADILRHSEPPANIKEEKTPDGKNVYVERRPLFLKEGLTYGEVVALSGDHFGSFDELDRAELAMIARLLPLIHSSKTKQMDSAKANPNYLKLALENAAHFSDPSNPVNNLNTYRAMHLKALMEPNMTRALMMNAAADHFLTDAFASGHMRVPRGMLDKALAVPSTILVGLTGIGSMLGSVLGTMSAHKSGDSELRGMLKGLITGLKESPHVLGGGASMALHDHDNEHGVQVKNSLGQTWTAYGDDNLNPGPNDPPSVKASKDFNRMMATKAVMSSQQEVQNMLLSTGQRKTEPPMPPYSAERFIPTPVQGYVAEVGHAVASKASSAGSWVHEKTASIGSRIGSIIAHVRKSTGSAMDATHAAAIAMLEKAKAKADALESKARDAIWGGKDAQHFVLTHQSELPGLSLDQKRELMRKLARRLVSAKDREAVAILYRATAGAERDAMSMEFGAQFSESAYSVRSAVALVPSPTASEVEALKQKGAFDAGGELDGVSDFQKATNYGWFGVGRAEGLVLIDTMLAAVHALGPISFAGGSGTPKQGEALILVTRLSDVLTAYLDQLGSTLPEAQRRALVSLLVKVNAWKMALQELVPAAAVGMGLAAMDKSARAAVERAAQYTGSFQGTADSSFRRVGDMIDRALFRPYTSMEGHFQLKVPVEDYFVGFALKVSAEREEDVKIGVEAGALVGIGKDAGDVGAELSAYKGKYIEARAKTGGDAMSLFSYGLYHSMRESPIPRSIPSYMWGGGKGNDAEAYRRAESWSAAMEMEHFAPLSKRLSEAKTDKEKEEIEDEIKNTYVEVGDAGELKGSVHDKTRKVEVSVAAQNGTRYDMESIHAAQGGQVGGRFIPRYLGDSFLTLGRSNRSVKLASTFEVEPFSYEGEFEIARLGATAKGDDSEWTVGLSLSAGMQLKFEEMAKYAKTFSTSAPKMVAWAAQIASHYPNAGPAALEIGNLAGEIAKNMGEGVSSVLELIAPVADKSGMGPKLTLSGEGEIGGGGPEGTVKLMAAENPKVEGEAIEAEIKIETMAAGVKFDKSGAHKLG